MNDYYKHDSRKALSLVNWLLLICSLISIHNVLAEQRWDWRQARMSARCLDTNCVDPSLEMWTGECRSDCDSREFPQLKRRVSTRVELSNQPLESFQTLHRLSIDNLGTCRLKTCSQINVFCKRTNSCLFSYCK